MKSKITITTNGEVVKRMATIKDDVITYKETPNIDVELVVSDDKIVLKKSGAINYQYTYIQGEKSMLLYIVELSGNKFNGSSEVTTNKYSKNDNLINLNCLVNDEIMDIIWEVN